MGDIDFSRGGYGGGPDEELFKGFTVQHMEYWWHFREVLRASDRKPTPDYWKNADGSTMSREDRSELIGLSLLNYNVHMGITEAIISFDEMQMEINRLVSPIRGLEARRLWRSAYSGLYVSFNALCNIVYVLIKKTSVLGENPDKKIWNYSPDKTIKLVQGRGHSSLIGPLHQINSNLEIRSHLDHYWVIWTQVTQGVFTRDQNFSKGYTVDDPASETMYSVDILQETWNTILENAKGTNLIYREIATTNGYLDQYIQAKGWRIDYSDFGEPHNRQRPQP